MVLCSRYIMEIYRVAHMRRPIRLMFGMDLTKNEALVLEEMLSPCIEIVRRYSSARLRCERFSYTIGEAKPVVGEAEGRCYCTVPNQMPFDKYVQTCTYDCHFQKTVGQKHTQKRCCNTNRCFFSAYFCHMISNVTRNWVKLCVLREPVLCSAIAPAFLRASSHRNPFI